MQDNTSIANFNVTFGKYEEPLLAHFEDIVYPAFNSDIVRIGKSKDDKYDHFFFRQVRVEEIEDEIVLIGQYIKLTEVVVINKMVGDNLISTDERYPSAPYSVFCIFLRNHRMLYIRHQGDSPTLRSFGSTVQYVFNNYIKKVKEEKQVKLPHPMVNVIGIPTAQSWENIFKNAIKVRKVSFRLFPLNGDQNNNDVIDGLYKMVIGDFRAKTAKVETGACGNVLSVKETVKQLDGVVEPAIILDYEKRKKVKIKNNKLVEKTTFEGTEDEMNSAEKIVEFGRDLDINSKVAEENENIYNKFKEVLKSFISKKE